MPFSLRMRARSLRSAARTSRWRGLALCQRSRVCRPGSARCGWGGGSWRRYARVSTADQNPDHQIDALLRAGVDSDHIHVDSASGAKASRPKPDLVMQLLREGDTLKVTRLDRLSRSVLHLLTFGAACERSTS